MFLHPIPGRRYEYKDFFNILFTIGCLLFYYLLLIFFFTCFISSDVILIDNSAVFGGFTQLANNRHSLKPQVCPFLVLTLLKHP